MSRGNSGVIGAGRLPARSGMLRLAELQQYAGSQRFISNSVRCRSNAANFTKSYSGTTPNGKKWTLRARVRLATGACGLVTFGTYGITYQNYGLFYFNGGKVTLDYGQYGVAVTWGATSNATLLDTTYFHDIHLVYDSDQSAQGNRFKLFIDGVRCGMTFSTGAIGSGDTLPVTNHTFLGGPGVYADATYLDGLAVGPEAFMRLDGTNRLIPYTGSYGTFGWHMEFADVGLTTASNVGLGKDTSGNANFLVTNGISVTPGATYDAFIDSPTVATNASTYATLDPNATTATTLTNCNLTASGTTDLPTILPTTGKWYFEIGGVAKTWEPPAAFPSAAGDYNFGQRPFTNAVPAGYKPLNIFNLQAMGA